MQVSYPQGTVSYILHPLTLTATPKGFEANTNTNLVTYKFLLITF